MPPAPFEIKEWQATALKLLEAHQADEITLEGGEVDLLERLELTIEGARRPATNQELRRLKDLYERSGQDYSFGEDEPAKDSDGHG